MEVTDKVRIFATLNQKDSMNGDSSERLSQESECREAGQYGILDEASAVALGVLKEIEALAGTTTCKSVQLVKLKKTVLNLESSSTEVRRMRYICHQTKNILSN